MKGNAGALRLAGLIGPRLSALRRLVVHNFGHVLEIPREGRLGVIDAGRERHCSSVCGMRGRCERSVRRTGRLQHSTTLPQ